MSEGGLDAIRSIKQIINDQDEKIWRVSAFEKCMKKEIEKLLTESKEYETQIETLKPNSFYRCTKDVPLLVGNAIDHEIQTHTFLLIAIDSKKIEIENKKRDIKLWEEKYKLVINDFQEAYENRKAFYELHNHSFKQLKQSEVAKKLASVEVKMLKAELKSVKGIAKELKIIKRKVLCSKIIKFVKAISKQRQNAELNVKLQKAMARKRELGAIMLEKQKAWKKQNSMNIQQRNNIFSNMMATIDFSKRDTISNKLGTSISKCSENHSTRMNVEIKPKLDKPPIDDKSKPKKKNNEEIKQNCNRIKVIDNQKISLPPLKSILNESRSKSKRGILSQDSKFSEKSQLQNKPIGFEKVNTMKEMDILKKIVTDQPSSPNPSQNISIEQLKNLKLITEKPQSIASKTPTKFSFKNRYKAENLDQLKISMSSAEGKKRKTDSEEINEDVSIPPTKKDRSVNFASPIEEHCDTMECSNNQKIDIDGTLHSNTSLLDYNTLEEEMVMPADCYQGNFSQMMTKPFSFLYADGAQTNDSSNIQPNPVTSPPSMFEDVINTRPTFKFSFGRGVSEATSIWNSFK